MKRITAAVIALAILITSACSPTSPDIPLPPMSTAVVATPIAPARSPTPSIVYNEVDSVVSKGTPYYNPEAYSESPSADEINELIHIDFETCIPESMESSKVYYTASYHAKDELTEIVVRVKAIEISITNLAWSSNSISHDSDYYKSPEYKRSMVEGVAVDAFVWPAHVQINPATGFYREWDACYLAFFDVDGYNYYIEGWEGITEEEFSQFIVHIISGYAK